MPKGLVSEIIKLVIEYGNVHSCTIKHVLLINKLGSFITTVQATLRKKAKAFKVQITKQQQHFHGSVRPYPLSSSELLRLIMSKTMESLHVRQN